MKVLFIHFDLLLFFHSLQLCNCSRIHVCVSMSHSGSRPARLARPRVEVVVVTSCGAFLRHPKRRQRRFVEARSARLYRGPDARADTRNKQPGCLPRRGSRRKWRCTIRRTSERHGRHQRRRGSRRVRRRIHWRGQVIGSGGLVGCMSVENVHPGRVSRVRRLCTDAAWRQRGWMELPRSHRLRDWPRRTPARRRSARCTRSR